MNINYLINATKNNLVKHSPDILVVVGIAGFVGTAVLTAKAAMKISPILNERESYLDDRQKLLESDDRPEEYTDEVAHHDLIVINATAVRSLILAFAPAASLALASGFMILKAHGIMKSRNAALAAAYSLVQRSFNEYRDRVREKLGEDEEHKLKFGKLIEATEDPDQDEEGKKKILRELSISSDISEYARVFDDASPQWERDPEYNLAFLRRQQDYFNDRLTSNHVVFLNEVYDALGLPRSAAGQIVGWVPSGKGDGYIDFGIYSADDSGHGFLNSTFINGLEGSVLLDFNVDGPVINDLKHNKNFR